jgi:hypothetical protein
MNNFMTLEEWYADMLAKTKQEDTQWGFASFCMGAVAALNIVEPVLHDASPEATAIMIDVLRAEINMCIDERGLWLKCPCVQ